MSCMSTWIPALQSRLSNTVALARGGSVPGSDLSKNDHGTSVTPGPSPLLCNSCGCPPLNLPDLGRLRSAAHRLLALNISAYDHHRRKGPTNARCSPSLQLPAPPATTFRGVSQAAPHARHPITTSLVADNLQVVPTDTRCGQRKGRTSAYDLVLSQYLFAARKQSVLHW